MNFKFYIINQFIIWKIHPDIQISRTPKIKDE